MTIKEFIEMLHKYIREEFIAVSNINGNEINIRFNNGTSFNITITEK